MSSTKSTNKVPPQSKAEKQAALATTQQPASEAVAASTETAATTEAPVRETGKGKKKGTTAPVEGVAPAPVEKKEPGKIEQILKLYTVDKLSRKAILDLGFHKTTIAIQTAKFRKLNPDFVETPNPPREVKEKPASAAAATSEASAANTAQ